MSGFPTTSPLDHMLDDPPKQCPRVFIPQEPMGRDENGRMKSLMNFAKAAKWGEPVVCLGSGPVALSPYPTKEALRECLRDFSDDDYIICVGDPSLIFMAAMIAGDVNRGRAKILKWDKELKDYLLVDVNIHQRLGQTD